MSFSGFIVQLINGLASASSLFLVAAGLSLIFGVTRIVNFAHGSFFMVGIYVAYSLVERLSGALGFWVALPLAALIVGVLGALIEVVLLRRIAVDETGQGTGTALFRAAVDWIFANSGAEAVRLHVRPENHRARHIYLREGFSVFASDQTGDQLSVTRQVWATRS